MEPICDFYGVVPHYNDLRKFVRKLESKYEGIDIKESKKQDFKCNGNKRSPYQYELLLDLHGNEFGARIIHFTMPELACMSFDNSSDKKANDKKRKGEKSV